MRRIIKKPSSFIPMLQGATWCYYPRGLHSGASRRGNRGLCLQGKMRGSAVVLIINKKFFQDCLPWIGREEQRPYIHTWHQKHGGPGGLDEVGGQRELRLYETNGGGAPTAAGGDRGKGEKFGRERDGSRTANPGASL